ncbi:MAG: hypothetical protein CMJ18_24480 [Phycisphaeraceae bacterium]|nr:hypothetical protein [Phycisphaeraceae bacterium]
MRRPLDWRLDPPAMLTRWPEDRRVVLLHSGRFESRWARRSIIAEPAGVYRFTNAGSSWTGGDCPVPEFSHKPFTDLRRLLDAGRGLWIGHLGYDLARWIEQLPTIAAEDPSWPVIELGYCPGHLVHDGATGRWTAHGTYARRLPELVDPAAPGSAVICEPASLFDRAGYEAAVQRVLEYVAAGDVFQVNLAQRFESQFDGPFPSAHRSLFGHLSTLSPAWYGAYLELGARRSIASTSPELFLEVDRSGQVVTRPIKGTRPAQVDVEVLRRSAKDQAELNMIVDLMRNDLGRVCAYGSIRVPEPRRIETHPTVHHGVATITGRLHERFDVVDLLRATMPGGSVTGAPKVRAMQIIDELEPVRRGPYCGCIGMLSREHTCLNIAIRTMLLDGDHGRVRFSVGGGIVADSCPAAEHEETLDKAQAMLGALKAAAQVHEMLGSRG